MLVVAPVGAQTIEPTKEQINGIPVSNSDSVPVHAGAANVFSSGMLQVPGAVKPVLSRMVDNRTTKYLQNSPTVSADDPCNTDPSGGANNQGKPIQVNSGTKYETYPLFTMPGEMGLSYELTFYKGAWLEPFAYSLDLACSSVDVNICKFVTYTRPDGTSLIFDGKPGVGPFTERGGGGLATLTYDSSSQTYTLGDEDATTKTFFGDAATYPGWLKTTLDASGIGWTLNYNGDASGFTTTITHTNGRTVTVVQGPLSYITVDNKQEYTFTKTVTDPGGNVYSLHNTYGQYDQITYPGSPATVLSLKYGAGIYEVDYNGIPYDYTTYVTDTASPYKGWANANYRADNTEGVFISYGTDSSGNLQATLTNSLGHQTTQNYGGTNGNGGARNGYLSLISDAQVSTCAATTHGRSYDANGHLSEEVDNNGNVHTYSYAVNGQLQSETEAYGTPVARTTDYVWDPSQQLNRLLSVTVEGLKRTTFTYDGKNRLASVSVTNLSANGLANQTLTTTYSYTLYPSGIVQSMSVTAPSPNGSDTTTSLYDSYGNITSVTNGLGQTTTYSNYNALGEVGHVVGMNGDVVDYTYDARGRVATKTTYPNGSAATWTYAYDGFGLLYSLSGPDGQVTTWSRDPSSMRVAHITHNDKDGTSTENFNYDANGDVIEHEIVRGGTVAQDEMYHYDALGRLYQKIGNSGQAWTYAYDGNGNTLSVTNAVGHSVVSQYDALNRVTQTTESGGASPAMPTTAPTINVPSSNTNGAYTVSWNSITGATFYVLQEKVGGGGWSNVQSSSAISWSPTGKTSNTYNYQVKACNSTGCSPWSATGSIVVAIPSPPTTAPSLSVPGSSANGNYTVSWTSVANTSTYLLQEQVNGGSWNTIQNSTSISWSVNGKTNGTYAYRSQACNAVGCGPWSNTGTMVVAWPAVPATPTMSWPGRNYSGAYTISWNSVANAASYPLYVSSNGGASWTQVQNSGATSWTASGQGTGTYYYSLAACDISGCSAAAGASMTVILPAPLAFNGANYWATNTVNPSGNEGIGFDIANGNTWEVFSTKPGNTHVLESSGAIPWGAATVQFTWTDAGVPAGFTNALGSIVYNYASSPTPVGNNPSTIYTTNTFNRNGDHAHTYSLRVDFFDATGVNISSTTCTLTAEVTGNL